MVFMYVVLLHYTVPVEEADLILPDHFEWVGRHYRSGDFIAEGRCPARDECSIVIARGMPRGQLEAILATDPLARQRMVRSEVLEFQALRTIPELAYYADRLTPRPA